MEFMKQVLPRLERPQTPGCALSLVPPSPYEPELPLKLYLVAVVREVVHHGGAGVDEPIPAGA